MITSASNRCKNCTGTCPTKKPRNKFLPESILFCVDDDASSLTSKLEKALADFERDAIGYGDFPQYDRGFTNYAKGVLRLAQKRLDGLPLCEQERKELWRTFTRTIEKGYFGPRDFARYGFYTATMPDDWYTILARDHTTLHKSLKDAIDVCLIALADAGAHYNDSLTKAKKQKARLEPSFCF